VGFAGRLEKSKGIDFIWRVVKELGSKSGVRFHLKGAVHWESHNETMRQLERYSDFVVHHQPGPHEEMPNFYSNLDVLLQPSRFENFGLAYAEAMATGLLVFAGIGGSGPEIVKDGETGFLVNPDGAVESVVKKLRIMSAEGRAFADIRLAARKDVETCFSKDSCIESKLALYRELLV
jgi:glycosyltransferase involved in cell wall biosynthesis